MNTKDMYQENIEKTEVNSTYQEIEKLLESGYTWFKRNDIGYGSIQEHFQVNDTHIAVVKKHPRLKDLKTKARVFVITDETQTNEPPVQTKESTPERTSDQPHVQPVSMVAGPAAVETDKADSSFAAFADL